MITSLVVWIIFGAVVGWLASTVAGTNQRQGFVGNVTIGIVGAIIGGFFSRALGGPAVTGFNVISILIATVGAVILVFFIGMLRHGAA